MKFKPQVPPSHYLSINYNTKERWISYWYQIYEVLQTKPKEILEIGVGNGTVSNYLKRIGLNVTTIDIDPQLKPDIVGSVTELGKFFRENQFDTVLCAEVLEHIPFRYFSKSLKEIYKVTKNFVVLTLPHSGIKLTASIKIPKFKMMNFVFSISLPKKHKFNGEHYWEIGKRGFSLKIVTKLINKYFIIKKNYLIPENPYHRVFLLKKF